jgi:hypothetical protein
MVRALVLPALFKEIVKLIPLLEFKYGFKFELDNLKVFRDDVCLSGATKLVNSL